MHFLQEMEEKQVRQCQAAWQLNPHRGYVFPFCQPTAQTLGSTVCLIKQMKYVSNIITTAETQSRNKGTIVINSLSWTFCPQFPGDRQDKLSNLTEPTTMYSTNVDDGPQKPRLGFEVSN